MSKEEKCIKGIIILFVLCVLTACNYNQKSLLTNCPNDEIKPYANHLDQLLLGHQPNKVHQLSDSLLIKYPDINCREMIRVRAAKANALELNYDFKDAIDIYNELLRAIEKNKFSVEEISVRLSMARAYESIGRENLCLENLKKAKKLIDEHERMDLYSRYCIRYSSYLRIYKNDLDSAKTYAANAVKLGEEFSVDRSIGDGYLLLGLLTKDFDQSIKYSAKAADKFLELRDTIGWAYQRSNIAKRYLRNNKFDNALKIANNVDAHAEALSFRKKSYFNQKKIVTKLKSKVFTATNQKDSAIHYLWQYNKYSELLGDVSSQEKVDNVLLKHEIKRQKEKHKDSKKYNQVLLLGVIILTVILSFLSRLYWLNNRKKNKIEEQTATITTQFNKLEELYLYKTTLLSEVHHRIKNNLQLIISLLALQKAKMNTNTNEILDMLSHRTSSISLIHEQLYNLKEFDTINVDLYAKSLVDNFQLLSDERNVILDQRIDDINLNLETVTPLGLIWSELISNSLKYNKDKKQLNIYFDLIKKGDTYFMHYYDTGKGYPEGQFTPSKHGMGFTIIQSLSRQLYGQIKAFNSNGAHFTLVFKEKNVSPIKG